MCVRSLVKTTNHACSYPSEFGGFLSLVVSIFCGWAGLFAAVDAVSAFGVAVALVVLSEAVPGQLQAAVQVSLLPVPVLPWKSSSCQLCLLPVVCLPRPDFLMTGVMNAQSPVRPGWPDGSCAYRFR